MPELPEVEVVRLSLEPRLVGGSFCRVVVRFPSLRHPLDQAALRGLANREILALRRRAKYLLIDFEGEDTLVIHLGMSGRFTLTTPEIPVETHEHLAFYLASGMRLRFVDPRRFGMAFVCSTCTLEADRHFKQLGVEPLGPELTGDYLQSRAAGRRGPIKNFLMDGRIVVGVGNIYASEALWHSHIHPKRSVGRVSTTTWSRVTVAIKKVLARAIEEGGTTLNDFADGEGNAGYFQVSLHAYGREGEPCQRCGRVIRRIVQGGRSSFYCPGCQH